jgi:hypothetical protein
LSLIKIDSLQEKHAIKTISFCIGIGRNMNGFSIASNIESVFCPQIKKVDPGMGRERRLRG